MSLVRGDLRVLSAGVGLVSGYLRVLSAGLGLGT